MFLGLDAHAGKRRGRGWRIVQPLSLGPVRRMPQ
jgi:hypothetical protein